MDLRPQAEIITLASSLWKVAVAETPVAKRAFRERRWLPPTMLLATFPSRMQSARREGGPSSLAQVLPIFGNVAGIDIELSTIDRRGGNDEGPRPAESGSAGGPVRQDLRQRQGRA